MLPPARMMRLVAISSVFLIVVRPNGLSLATAEIHRGASSPSPLSSRTRSYNGRRENHRTSWTPNDCPRRGGGSFSSRHLSAVDQLNILKLGFIPTSSSSSSSSSSGDLGVDDDEDSMPMCSSMARNLFACRGGGIHSTKSRGHAGSATKKSDRIRDRSTTCRRQLSVEEQLDILKLGFIPTTTYDDSMEGRDSQQEDSMPHHFSGRGGGIDANERSSHLLNRTGRRTSSSYYSRRQLSTVDSENGAKSTMYGVMAYLGHRGGGMDDVHDGRSRSNQSSNRARQAAKPNASRSGRKQLSTAEQLDILKLGFIPTSSNSRSYYDELSPLSSNNAMSNFGNRGGGNLEDEKDNPSILRHLAFASIMAFLAGYSDILCLKKFGCYAAMMSGNIVHASISLAEQDWAGAAWRLSLVGSYFVGAAGVRFVELMFQTGQQKTVTEKSSNLHLKAIAPVVAAIFAIADMLLQRRKSYMSLLALGFGMTYASANRALNATITQLLTGHVTKLGAAISDRIVGAERKWTEGSLASVCILGSFISGGILATIITGRLTDFPYFSVLGIVYALVLASF